MIPCATGYLLPPKGDAEAVAVKPTARNTTKKNAKKRERGFCGKVIAESRQTKSVDS